MATAPESTEIADLKSAIEGGSVVFDGLSPDDRVMNRIVSGNWEDVLIFLTKDMDPWNIDIIALNGRFMEHIRKTSQMDLRIPAKILLAAAILYRLKAESLQGFESAEQEPASEELDIPEEPESWKPDIIPMRVPLLRAPKRKVSLDDLMAALDKAMTVRNRREVKEKFRIELTGKDITKMIEEIYEKINSFLEGTREGKMIFSTLFRKEDRDEKIRTFQSILHLSSQERISCRQEQLFGEIEISLLRA